MYKYEYVWIDSVGNLRSKIRISNIIPKLENIPQWNFDGTSTGQADNAQNSEVILNPVKLYHDPFKKNVPSYLILCECFDQNCLPLPSNTRNMAKTIFEQKRIGFNLHRN